MENLPIKYIGELERAEINGWLDPFKEYIEKIEVIDSGSNTSRKIIIHLGVPKDFYNWSAVDRKELKRIGIANLHIEKRGFRQIWGSGIESIGWDFNDWGITITIEDNKQMN